jgi:hypothetical protein
MRFYEDKSNTSVFPAGIKSLRLMITSLEILQKEELLLFPMRRNAV